MKSVKFEIEATQEQPSQASIERAFLGACNDGNLHVLNQLVELAPDQVLLMIEANGYEAFQGAANGGHLTILNRLVELAPSLVLLMIEANNYSAFQCAAEGCHLPVVSRIMELAPDLVPLMIEANNYIAFLTAAECGDLPVLNRLVELAPDHVSSMISARGNIAFECAVNGGHLPVVNRIMELAPDLMSRMTEEGYYTEFQGAAQNGHLPILNRFVELAPAHVSRMIEAGGYGAFQGAANGGHLPVLNRLLQLAPGLTSLMIEANDYCAFQEAASGGHLPVLNRLIELAPGLLSLMIEANDYNAFQGAAIGGHLPVLNRLVELAPSLVSLMIAANDYSAFQGAARDGHLPVLNLLVALAPDLVSLMIEANDYSAFQQAASDGHLPVLNRLIELAPELVSLMIAANDYSAFQWAARNGHLPVLNRLIELAPDLVSLMIAANDYYAFQGAASRGHLPVLDRLVGLAPDLVSRMIEANSYAAFQGAADAGYLSILNRLMELAPDEVSVMIEENLYAAFSSLARHHMDDIVNRALCDPCAFAHAEMHQEEYGERYVNPFIRSELTALRALKTAVALENRNAVFNIADETRATRCFYIIRNLIRRNYPASLDDMCFLLAIPAVQALAHTPVTNNVPNELLRLALTMGHQEAAAALLAMPAVHTLAAQHQFYHQEVGGQLDLSALARNQESSMRALSKSEQQRLQAATSRYEPLIRAAGVDNIMSDLRQTLTTRYAEEPAHILGGQGEWINLPQDWHAFKHLVLTEQQRSDALTAYHQHKDHTAWRYLLKPNPWMAEDASYVKVNPKNAHEKWSTFEIYKPLISMLYFAAGDEGAPPTNGHTLETRLSHFFDELAHIGRAHNWDDSRVNARGGSEQYDDLKGDKPSCSSGVPSRLAQSLLGHRLFEMLTLEGVKQELRAFMREHFIKHITPDNLAELNDACVRLYEGVECGVGFAALNVSETEQHVFLQYMTDKYALQFTRDASFEHYIKTSFCLSELFPSHVARFAVETSFVDLLSIKRKHSQLGESSQRDAKKPNTATLEGLASCGTFRAAARVSHTRPTGELSDQSGSSAAM